MSHFSIHENPEGTYRIECLFVVYRERFGHHPRFIHVDEEKGRREGFNTQYYYLVEDDINKNEAKNKLKEYQEKYDDFLYDIENDDRLWKRFPFKNNTIIYCK